VSEHKPLSIFQPVLVGWPRHRLAARRRPRARTRSVAAFAAFGATARQSRPARVRVRRPV